MKLIFCPVCQDVFKLIDTVRYCRCGNCSGRYIDKLKAEVNGKGISIAFSSFSLSQAISKLNTSIEKGFDSNRRSYYFTAWIRPNEGTENPNTIVVKD
jgi:DNA-directed RNA polymerase subunit RPC12/RpoP